MNQITIKGDFSIGNEEYWQYECTVHVRYGEIWDTEIVWAKGVTQDDESLDITEFIEDHIKEVAETRAWEMLHDPFTTVSFEKESE